MAYAEIAESAEGSGSVNGIKTSKKKGGSTSETATTQATTGISGERIKSFVQRIERLEEEKKAIAEDVRDVYSEAKATGFDPKIMRKMVAKRKMSLETRREQEELLELYETALLQASLNFEG